MSNRLDRSLGVKPFNNSGNLTPAPKRWSLKLSTVYKWMVVLLLVAGAYSVLSSTSHCQEGIRCAD